MKYAVVILDGAAGEPLDIFDGKTSLEQAHTPFLDALAQEGTTGFSKNVPMGMEPSSNVACMSIMGYSPLRYDIGRGAIEGASIGVKLDEGDVALRMNLSCVENGRMKSYSSGNITTEDSWELADELISALDDETFSITKGVAFRHILKVKGCPQIMKLAFTAPHDITDQPIAGCEPQVPKQGALNENLEELKEAAALLCNYQNKANEILAASPVNARRIAQGLLPATHAWVFWPGMRPSGMSAFATQYGKKAGMLSPVDLLNGLAELTGMTRYSVPGLTDGPDNDYPAQGTKAIEMLAENDIIFIHVESPDTAGHDGEPQEKVDAIEAIDREIIGRLVTYRQEHPSTHLRILALPDHPTPIALKTHSNKPVPFVLSGHGINKNIGDRLTEVQAARSGLIMDPGYLLMKLLLL